MKRRQRMLQRRTFLKALLRRGLSFLLPCVLVMTGMPGEGSVHANATWLNGFPNPCGYEETIDGPLPRAVRPCSTNGFKFNSPLYYHTWSVNNAGKTHGPLQWIVYGNASHIPESIQRYKKGWQSDASDPATVNDPPNGEGHAYVWDAYYGRYTYGEYLYVGFTESGQPYHNRYFINDAQTTTALSRKHWIRNPWDALPDSYRTHHGPLHPGNVYRNNSQRTEDPMSPLFSLLRDNLTRSLGFTIQSGVDYARPFVPLPEHTDPRAYMAIQQTPTTREAGVGTMYHYSWSSRSVWFQTFPLQRFSPTEKVKPALTCTSRVLSHAQPLSLTNERYMRVRIAVVGAIQDESYVNSAMNQALYYTRQDIAAWHVSFGTQTLQSSSPNDGVRITENRSQSTFELVLDTDALDRSQPDQWVYTTTAKVQAFYHNHTAESPSFSTQTCAVKVLVHPSTTGSTMQSQFGIVPEIVFAQKSDFVASHIGYEDWSYGQDADGYTFTITNIADGSSHTVTYEPAVPQRSTSTPGALDKSAVQSFLHTFIASKFSATTLTRQVLRFRITQKIFDRALRLYRTSEMTKELSVVHIPPTNDCMTADAPPLYIQPLTTWPLDWYDTVPFPVTEVAPTYIPSSVCTPAPSYSSFTKDVYIDGNRIDSNAFFNSAYAFAESMVGLREVKVVWTAPDGTKSVRIRHVVIHASKPALSMDMQGLFKVNRALEATVTATASNDPWVEQHAPLEITSFSFGDADDSALRCRTGYCQNNRLHKIFTHKKAGTYTLHLRGKRTIPYGNGQTITRWSDPYDVTYEIVPDHPPAIIAHPYGAQISRLNLLQMAYDVQSTDGDTILTKVMNVYYDADNDGTCETWVHHQTGDILKPMSFTNVGQYQYVVETQETTTQSVLAEFYEVSDGARTTYTGYFVVDNYEPSSALYLDTPPNPPDVDVLLVLDPNLNPTTTDEMRNNKVTLTNRFTAANMRPTLDIWDLKAYEYTQTASHTIETQQTVPPNTYAYCSNGYCGTLTRSSITDTPYAEDRGYYTTQTNTMTATLTCDHTIIGMYAYTGVWTSQYDSGDCPTQSMAYDDGQYRGVLPRVGTTGTSCPYRSIPLSYCTAKFTATYTGTVQYTHLAWVSQWVTIHQYRGTYHGTISKKITQPYDTSFFRAGATKYLVYVTDNTINQRTAWNHVQQQHENAQTIVIGDPSLQNGIAADYFIPLEKSTDIWINTLISTIQKELPVTPAVYRLVGETLTTHTATFDMEGDPLAREGDQLQITHQPNYFDHSEGYGTFSGQTMLPLKNESAWHPYQSEITLTKPGKYTLIHRVRDAPSADLRFAPYGYFSKESSVEVIAHRAPIADVDLDWRYDPATHQYKTTWIDRSYDWDHKIQRATTDRGIAVRTLLLFDHAKKETRSTIPTSLDPGTYTFTYRVKDLEGAWSAPIVRTISLPLTPQIQLRSTVQPLDETFTLDRVPAGDSVVAKDITTRYPFATHLEYWFNDTLLRTEKTPQGGDTIEQTWAPFTHAIDPTTPDATYRFRIRAKGFDAQGKTIQSTFDNDYVLRILTPIGLDGAILRQNIPVSDVTARTTYDITANTSKYTSLVGVNAFAGTPWQQIFVLQGTTVSTLGTGQKKWTFPLSLQNTNIPDGSYVFRWLAQTYNDNVQIMEKTVTIKGNRAPVAQFSVTPDMPYEGDTVTLRSTSTDADEDVLQHAWTITSPQGIKTTHVGIPVTLSPVTVGTYTIRLRSTDAKGAWDEEIRSLSVGDLLLNASVGHTAEWDRYREDWNMRFPKQSRDDAMFWGGEVLVLRATMTKPASYGPTPLSVKAHLQTMNETVSLATQSATSFTHFWMRPPSAPSLFQGEHTMRFTGRWSNGHEEIVTLPFQISHSIYDVFRVQRRL